MGEWKNGNYTDRMRSQRTETKFVMHHGRLCAISSILFIRRFELLVCVVMFLPRLEVSDDIKGNGE